MSAGHSSEWLQPLTYASAHDPEAVEAFGTPNIVHFCAVLLFVAIHNACDSAVYIPRGARMETEARWND